MQTAPITPGRLTESVIAVPPLARDSKMALSPAENAKLVRFLEDGGVSALLYGGNAVLYHVRLTEYERLLGMLSEVAGESTLVVPSVGPSFGMMMDQAEVLQQFDFPTVMVLPQRDIADAAGIANGIRRFVDSYGKPIVLYLKHDRWLPPETVGKMYSSGVVSWIKYAVVRDNPLEDDYLRQVLGQVPAEVVVSGIGEQPAIIHMRDFEVASFTSGCVCVNPRLSMDMLSAVQAKQYESAETMRAIFEPLEDLRNGINPIRVLHRAVELAEIANTGPMYPLLGELTADETSRVAKAASELLGVAGSAS